MQAVKQKQKQDRRTLDEIRTAGIKKNAKERQALKKKANEVLYSSQPPAYTNPILVAYRLAHYFWQQDNKVVNRDSGATAAYTETGLIRALGIDHTVFKAYAAGERDYLTYSDTETREEKHSI